MKIIFFMWLTYYTSWCTVEYRQSTGTKVFMYIKNYDIDVYIDLHDKPFNTSSKYIPIMIFIMIFIVTYTWKLFLLCMFVLAPEVFWWNQCGVPDTPWFKKSRTVERECLITTIQYA